MDQVYIPPNIPPSWEGVICYGVSQGIKDGSWIRSTDLYIIPLAPSQVAVDSKALTGTHENPPFGPSLGPKSPLRAILLIPLDISPHAMR